MSSPPILLSLDSNEAARPRAEKIREAAEKDDHFEAVSEISQLPFDLLATWTPVDEVDQKMHTVGTIIDLSNGENKITRCLHIEIKDFGSEGNSDYLSSILSGHLWEQVLAARELGEPLIIAVLGDDRKTQEAIRKAAGHPTNGTGFNMEKFLAYSSMVDGFEANCEGAHVRILHLGYNQFPRLLLRIRKILQGGDLSGFAPNPSDGERLAVGLSILAGRGFGPKKSLKVLEKFRVWLLPKLSDAYLTDCDGIGDKLALQLAHSENIRVPCQNVYRPKAARRAKA